MSERLPAHLTVCKDCKSPAKFMSIQPECVVYRCQGCQSIRESKAFDKMRILASKDLAAMAKLAGSSFVARSRPRSHDPLEIRNEIVLDPETVLWLAELAMEGLEK